MSDQFHASKKFSCYRFAAPTSFIQPESLPQVDKEEQTLLYRLSRGFLSSRRPCCFLTFFRRIYSCFPRQEFCKVVFPPLAPLVKTTLGIGRSATIKGTSLIQLFGYWRPSNKKKDEHEEKDEEGNKTDCPHSEDARADEGGGWTEVKKKKKNAPKKHHQIPESGSKAHVKDTQSVEIDSRNEASSSV